MTTSHRFHAESPQWNELLFLITYDEHGGFFDHVVPPVAADSRPEFAQLGIRVPAFAIGPTVRRGYVSKKVVEHSSVAKTVQQRFGIASLGPRMDASDDLTDVIDPKLYKTPQAPAAGMPTFALTEKQAFQDRIGISSQPELEEMIRDGRIAKEHVDSRTSEERVASWMRYGAELGVVRVRR